MSRRIFFSCQTSRPSHDTLNGAVSSFMPRSARTSITSPSHTWDRRSSSTATGRSPEAARGSFTQTTLRARSTVVRIAALPSRSSRMIGEETSSFISWLHFMRIALAHRPPSRIHCTRVAGGGGAPGGRRRASRSRSTLWNWPTARIARILVSSAYLSAARSSLARPRLPGSPPICAASVPLTIATSVEDSPLEHNQGRRPSDGV